VIVPDQARNSSGDAEYYSLPVTEILEIKKGGEYQK
jgi:hypothetical protein